MIINPAYVFIDTSHKNHLKIVSNSDIRFTITNTNDLDPGLIKSKFFRGMPMYYAHNMEEFYTMADIEPFHVKKLSPIHKKNLHLVLHQSTRLVYDFCKIYKLIKRLHPMSKTFYRGYEYFEKSLEKDYYYSRNHNPAGRLNNLLLCTPKIKNFHDS